MLRRSLFALASLALLWAPVQAATIPDSQAASHVGQTFTVQGSVSGVHVSAKGTVFLNFGAPYPNQDFTAVIFSYAAPAFGNVNRFEGKHLAVTGPISMWKGKPEVILRAPAQLRAMP